MDKPNVQQAIAEIGNMVKVFRAFENAQNVLGALATAEAQTKEITSGLEKQRVEYAAETKKLAESLSRAKVELEVVRAAADQLMADAKRTAGEMVAEATTRTKALTDKGAKALKAAENARDTVLAEQEELMKDVHQLQKEFARLEPVVEHARKIVEAVGT